MLFLPERHEPLTTEPWDEAKARAALLRIVAETNAAFTPQGLWPIHPQDVSPERPPDCMKMLYNGAAGVIWALHELADRKHAPLQHDFLPIVRSLMARHHADLEKYEGIRNYIGHEQNGFLFGETGLDLLERKLTPRRDEDLETASQRASKAKSATTAASSGAERAPCSRPASSTPQPKMPAGPISFGAMPTPCGRNAPTTTRHAHGCGPSISTASSSAV